jgi:sulfatase modifying factor 1
MKRTASATLVLVAVLLLDGCPTPNDSDVSSYSVTVSSTGAQGGESVAASASAAEVGATVTLTATLNNGRKVALSATGVTINPSTVASSGDSATFTMPGAAVGVTAAFGFAVGATETVSVGSESLSMIYANDSSSMTFPTGTDDSGTATLTRRFWIAETEVTNAVVAAVLQWAYDNSRFSATVGDHNGLDTDTVKHGGRQLLNLSSADCRVDYDGSGTFSVESGYEDRPVTNVTWYGAVMLSNWMTEMRDGNTNNVVYAGIDTDWTAGETTEDGSRTGFRLPTSDEWEYAARYGGTDSTNTVSGYSNPYFTQGDSASGATADIGDAPASRAVAVYNGSSPAPLDEAAVKSLGTGGANALGVYDMSGNVSEWCFTQAGGNPNFRVHRGGTWNNVASLLRWVANPTTPRIPDSTASA